MTCGVKGCGITKAAPKKATKKAVKTKTKKAKK
jgi:hypothetical protein